VDLDAFPTRGPPCSDPGSPLFIERCSRASGLRRLGVLCTVDPGQDQGICGLRQWGPPCQHARPAYSCATPVHASAPSRHGGHCGSCVPPLLPTELLSFHKKERGARWREKSNPAGGGGRRGWPAAARAGQPRVTSYQSSRLSALSRRPSLSLLARLVAGLCFLVFNA
jgi:hypothetical protein